MASPGHCPTSWRSPSMLTSSRATPSSSGVKLGPLFRSSSSATVNGSTRASTCPRSTPTWGQVQRINKYFCSFILWCRVFTAPATLCRYYRVSNNVVSFCAEFLSSVSHSKHTTCLYRDLTMPLIGCLTLHNVKKERTRKKKHYVMLGNGPHYFSAKITRWTICFLVPPQGFIHCSKTH